MRGRYQGEARRAYTLSGDVRVFNVFFSVENWLTSSFIVSHVSMSSSSLSRSIILSLVEFLSVNGVKCRVDGGGSVNINGVDCRIGNGDDSVIIVSSKVFAFAVRLVVQDGVIFERDFKLDSGAFTGGVKFTAVCELGDPRCFDVVLEYVRCKVRTLDAGGGSIRGG